MTTVSNPNPCESCGRVGCLRRVLAEDEPNFHVYVWTCRCGHEQDEYVESHHLENDIERIDPVELRRWMTSVWRVAAILMLMVLGIGGAYFVR